jgi:hypothetical protein
MALVVVVFMCVRKVAVTSGQSTDEAFVRRGAWGREIREDRLSISVMLSLELGVKVKDG